MAKKKEPGKAIVAWDEDFANMASKNVQNIKVSEGQFLSFKGGRLTYQGENIEDDELRCVIVAWEYHNAYYDPDVAYDPKNPASPLCYATSADMNSDLMEPHADAPDKQHDSCAECPFNQFESDPKGGKGKACKNGIRLGLIAESDLEDLDSAEIVWASIPTMSIKNWLGYVKTLEKSHQRPPLGMITLLKVVPDGDSQFRVTFKAEERIDLGEHGQALKDLFSKVSGAIDFPYQEREAKPAAKGKAGKGKPSKFARR